MPVNLESQNLMISDFSVLHEIFHPTSTAASVDPRLVLSTGRAPAYLAPDRKGAPLSPAPGPVPLSVHELEAKPDPGDLDPAAHNENVTQLTSVSVSVSAVSPISPDPAITEGKSSPVDIVHLAAEEIRKPLLKFRDESKAGRVPWNLAGLVTHLPGGVAEPPIPPYPGYPAPGHHSGYSPHLGLHTDISHAPYPGANFGTSMGVTPPTLTAPVTSASVSGITTPAVTGAPTYKMEPGDPGLYYPGPGGLPEPDPHTGPVGFQPSHPSLGVPGAGPELGSADFMQTLQTYMGQPGSVDMQHHEDGGSWLGEHSGLHPGFLSQEFDYVRGGDRKKRIIQEWNKTNKSPRPPETLTSGDPLRHGVTPGYLSAAAGHPADLFQHPYNPYNVKDEPPGGLRPEYPYYGYSDLVNPYVHMGRKEKRKKHDSLPGGQTLTRDERKATQMGLPIQVKDIIDLPMDEFNDLLSKHELTEEQLTLCRDIRRRGKNKVAAQNCRKRKIDQIKQLETEVTRIKCRKTELVSDHDKLLQQRATWSDLVKRLHDYVLKELGRDPQHWQLQMDHQAQVHILRRPSAPGHLGTDQAHHQQPLQPHDQAVNMAAPPVQKGQLYDMPGSHPHQPHLHQGPGTLSQNSS